jgi:IS5 family transposase
MPDGASRLVSLHDPDARPIRKGRIGRPVEFGYKAQVVDNADGVVLDHQIMVGNPPDAPLLAPAIEQVIARTGKVPRAVTADRGYGEAGVDSELTTLGVGRVAIPRRGRAGPARQAVERQRGFRRLVKWRTGCEGRISCLKHRFGWDRTRMAASKVPASGAAMVCSPTTWSRSAGCWKPSITRPHEDPRNRLK